jgi:multiple sugar transport system substrate-binding protein
MVARDVRQRPFPLPGPGPSRRQVLLGFAGAAAVPLLGACGGSDAASGGDGTGPVSIGSNSSNPNSKAAWQATFDAFTAASGIEVEVNTTDHDTFQQQINSYLQGSPQDVFMWNAGYRMRALVDDGLVSDMSDVWAAVGDNYSAAQKEVSTAADGKQYFLPFFQFPWAVFYRRSLFEERGYQVPATMDEFTALAARMEADGLVPLAFAAKDGWPQMGMFDILDMRINGFDHHMALMRGEEPWTGPRVAAVFEAWRALFPHLQGGALGRSWQEAAGGVVNKEAGMMYHGMSLGSEFTGEASADLDFFPFPVIDPAIGGGAMDAPIDGLMISKDPDDRAAVHRFLEYMSTGEAQMIRLRDEPSEVAAGLDADTSLYTPLQKKAAEFIASAENVAQFMDRDTAPAFASTVLTPALQQFIGAPDDYATVQQQIEQQRKPIFG